jgi:hypothetical protein
MGMAEIEAHPALELAYGPVKDDVVSARQAKTV